MAISESLKSNETVSGKINSAPQQQVSCRLASVLSTAQYKLSSRNSRPFAIKALYSFKVSGTNYKMTPHYTQGEGNPQHMLSLLVIFCGRRTWSLTLVGGMVEGGLLVTAKCLQANRLGEVGRLMYMYKDPKQPGSSWFKQDMYHT